MKLLFKQRLLSLLDSYDIYDERGDVAYTVEGQLSLGHRLCILDAAGNPIGLVKEVVLSFLPRFELYLNDRMIGTVRKEFTLVKPRFALDVNGWTVEGNWLEWDYAIRDASGATVATLSKEILNWTDTYVIDAPNPDDALPALMITLAIDAEKCSRG